MFIQRVGLVKGLHFLIKATLGWRGRPCFRNESSLVAFCQWDNSNPNKQFLRKPRAITWKPMRWKPLGWFLGEAAKSVTENLKRGNFNEEKVLATDLGLRLSILPGIIPRQVGLRGLWNLKSLRLPPWELKPSFHEYGQTKTAEQTQQQQKWNKFPD